MTIAEMRDYRRVPAKRGMRVRVDGKMGVITGNYGDRIRVRFDGYSYSRVCHPRWQVTYYKPDGDVLLNTDETRPGVQHGTLTPRS